jgi:NAD(P)-dependent dehydrogenase (short-subunit alcohol dehydrogenase family)
MRDFEGKVAIVTGGGSVAEGIGNGRAAAVLLARHGARVGVLDVVIARADETCRLIAEDGGSALPLEADVANMESAHQAVEAVHGEFGRVDVLVNNVGIVGAPGTVVDVDPDQWDEVMRVNLKSIVLMSKYSIPYMQENGGGAIVNIASGAGLLGGHPALAYPTSKGAVISMTRAMAYHHGPAGIRVNCIAPGYIYTPRVAARERSVEEAVSNRERRRQAAPLHTEGTGWDIGEAVLYLASDRARWITGVVLPVDAGFTAGKV